MPQPRRLLPALFLTLLTASVVHAQPPAPLGEPALAFPGGWPSPPDAESAARAMADAWLGMTPYSNPAAPIAWGAGVSLFALHVARQDLRADNRNYDEVSVYLGGAGAMFGARVRPTLALWAYAWRPESRFEENTYNAGTGTDPSVQPAIVTNHIETRETRAGVGVSAAFGALRVGAAVELTARKDLYRVNEQSGGPSSGIRELSFDGTAVGGQAGIHWSRGETPKGRLELGAAMRWLPELDVAQTPSPADVIGPPPAQATREAAWEGGVSAAYGVGEALRLIAGAGGRSAQAWEGFGVESGASTQWSIAVDLHDARDPWAVHVSAGRGTQDDVPEPSSSLFGVGGGWQFGTVEASVGVLRRGLHRDGAPTSYDDRFFGGISAHW
jgi:hypothetical protein